MIYPVYDVLTCQCSYMQSNDRDVIQYQNEVEWNQKRRECRFARDIKSHRKLHDNMQSKDKEQITVKRAYA